MKSHVCHAIGAAALAVLATNSIAQEPPEGRKPTQPEVRSPTTTQGMTKDYTSIDRIKGAKVSLAPSAEDAAEARREGEEADRPNGKVSEWLIDTHDGSVAHAVVSFGGFLGMGDKTVLVPAENLQWDATKEEFRLAWSPEQFKARPSFDLDEAIENGLDTTVERAAGARMPGDRTTPTDDGRRTGGVTPTDRPDQPLGTDATGRGLPTDASGRRPAMGRVEPPYKLVSQRLCKASELASLPVHAGREKFGDVEDLVIDRNKKKVVLAIVEADDGGKSYLVPFEKLQPCTEDASKPNEVDLLCAAETSRDQLMKVEYHEPSNKTVVDPAAAERALESVRSPK